MAKTSELVTPAVRRKRVGLECPIEERRTEQCHKDACDMNVILRDYHKTGLIRHAQQHKGRYDDVSGADFQQAMFIVKEAQDMFQALPANVRKRFGQDPAEFLAFVQDPANKDEMARMGILKGNDGVDIRGVVTAAPVADKAPQAPEEPPSGA